MGTIKEGGAAFPAVYWDRDQMRFANAGMSMRDYFAAKAMQSLIMHNGEECQENMEINCERAYQYADLMLKAREQ